MGNQCCATQQQTKGQTKTGRLYQPRVDVFETAEALVLRADLPGTTAEDISLEFERGKLSIHGKVNTRQPDDLRYLRQEYGVADFQRTFEIGEDIDSSKIAAQYIDGVLTLTLPKAETVKPRRIQVVAA